jgi:hypothetical protein
LCKPLRSRWRWLINARILANKSEQCVSIGQMMMHQYYPHLPSIRTVTNALLEPIGSAWEYVQTTLLNLWSSRMPGPGWKLSSRLLWCCINLLCTHWCRQPSNYSWWKM